MGHAILDMLILLFTLTLHESRAFKGFDIKCAVVEESALLNPGVKFLFSLMNSNSGSGLFSVAIVEARRSYQMDLL